MNSKSFIQTRHKKDNKMREGGTRSIKTVVDAERRKKKPKNKVVFILVWFSWFTCAVWGLCWYHYLNTFCVSSFNGSKCFQTFFPQPSIYLFFSTVPGWILGEIHTSDSSWLKFPPGPGWRWSAFYGRVLGRWYGTRWEMMLLLTCNLPCYSMASMASKAPPAHVPSWILEGPPLCNTWPIPPGNDENGEETATFQTLDKDGNGDFGSNFFMRLRFFVVALGMNMCPPCCNFRVPH